MKNNSKYFMFGWGLGAVALMAIGAGLIYPEASLIVAGLALYIDNLIDKGRPE